MENTNKTESTIGEKIADEADIESVPETEAQLPSVIGLFLKGTVRDIAEATQERLDSMKNLLFVAIVAPVALLVVGVIIAANSDSVSGVNTGRGFITFGTFLATLLCAIILLRARVYAFAITGVSRAARLMLNMSPSHTPAEVEKYMVYFYGIMSWVAGVCIYAQVVEIWRSVGTSLIVATVMMGLAAIMAARWFSGRLAQKALVVLMLGTLVISTIRLKSPRFLHLMDDAGDFAFGTDGHTDADRDLLKKFNEERLAIRKNAADKCGGKYCSEGDVARVKELDKNIHLIETGQYWSTMEANSASATATAKPVPTTVKTDAVPAKPTKASSPQTNPPAGQAGSKPETRPESKAAATPKSNDSDPFAALDQFPDVPPVK